MNCTANIANTKHSDLSQLLATSLTAFLYFNLHSIVFFLYPFIWMFTFFRCIASIHTSLWAKPPCSGLSISNCYSWECLMGPSCYRWTWLQLMQFTQKVTNLLPVRRSRLQVNQNLMTALMFKKVLLTRLYYIIKIKFKSQPGNFITRSVVNQQIYKPYKFEEKINSKKK